MARLAAEPLMARTGALEALVQPTRERAELAIRLALICALTTLATQYYATPEPALTAYLVFFLNKPERTTSLILNVAFVVLIAIVLGLVLLLATKVVDAPAWRWSRWRSDRRCSCSWRRPASCGRSARSWR